MLAILLPLCVPDPGLRAAERPRPELSGPELTLATDDGRFLLHYTLEGRDAVAGDLGLDGVPELVHRASDGLSLGVEAFRARGWRELVGDTVGTDAIDVYLKDVDINGYAYPAAPAPGSSGSSCFMELDHALNLVGVMESVAIHELHHCVEYRYTTEARGWIYEATATYEQYLAYLDVTLEAAVNVLYSWRLGQPDQPLDHRDGDYEYAGFILMQFWERFGGVDPLRLDALWAALEADPDWQVALDAAADEAWGLTLPEVFVEYATWNLFACGNADGQHYGADALPCNEAVSVPIDILEPDEVSWSTKLGKTPYTAAYAEAPAPPHGVTVTCTAAKAAGVLAVRALAVDADGVRGATADGALDDEGLVQAVLEGPLDDRVRLVVASVGQDAVGRVSCTLEPHDAPTSSAGDGASKGCSTSPGPVGWWGLPGLLLLLTRRRGGPGARSTARCP